MFVIFFCHFFLLANMFHTAAEGPKRLLVNYPQMMRTDIEHLQNQVAALITKTDKEIADLKTKNNQLENTLTSILSSRHGATYTHWGSKSCPSINGTDMIYSGICGGSGYGESGGAAEYVCLPHDPEFVAESELTNIATEMGHMWGSEYQASFATAKIDDDVPCAVCQVSAAATIMIPAKTTCPSGWSVQYHGYLVAGHYGHAAASHYICVDKHPEYFEGRRTNLDGKLLYGVRTVCGSLPCPPYENNRLLPCAVCSK